MKALIVEDDRGLNQGIVIGIKEPEDEFTQCYNLKSAKEELQQKTFDLIILDINLPDGNGYDFLKEFRKVSQIPVLILTANDLETDEVMGFELGANDFMTKPFSLMVLKARVKNLLRAQAPKKEIYEMGDLRFDFETMEFYQDGQELLLSRTEVKLLQVFLRNQGIILSKEKLIDLVWSGDDEFVDDNVIYVSIRRLRNKLTSKKNQHQYIQTVYGHGYIWRSES
ncbi:two-component response regulator [Lachnospiraceae bacterium KM106-2]|nr:two-component response regulator [Lachnospiraceae bacterium KM106-2]